MLSEIAYLEIAVGSGHGLIEFTVLSFAWRGWGRLHKSLVRSVGLDLILERPKCEIGMLFGRLCRVKANSDTAEKLSYYVYKVNSTYNCPLLVILCVQYQDTK
jgi:hypothetical protein